MRKSFLVVFFILFLPLLASAAIREDSFEINPFFGYCISANSPEFCHKKIVGLRVGYNITRHWEIEGAYNKVESSAKLIGFDALYHLTPEKAFTPFLLAGVGYGHVEPEHRPHFDTMMGDVGAGFKFAFNDTVALRSEIRDVVTHSNNVIVSAGLTFTFGGKTPKAAPAPVPAAVTTPAPVAKPETKPEPVVTPAPETKPAPAPQPVAAPRPEPITIVLEDVHFANDRYSLTPATKEILNRNIAKLRENPGLEIEIQGHTSAIGSDDHNMTLSIRRAEEVKKYLVAEGVAAERLTTKGYGETMPEIKETKPRKESKAAKANRRVHFEILVK